ncbi:hypothetical protein PRIPAC_81842 [Pristionchus pacificus]|uniref:Uncharacterized protein n=1 Tax=Pristionchus pacificus TaxID=54126 RepID=A0A2A6BE16_PRIPA|nr:hypothetical protein PRIPAC_81842 [Pristionchus pacificus]|eukprot:PDM64113.1 hypothetical protein PRIPAC_54357 [Pristionchus pacificus]
MDLDSSEMGNEKKSDKVRKDSGKERPPETLQEATAVDGESTTTTEGTTTGTTGTGETIGGTEGEIITPKKIEKKKKNKVDDGGGGCLHAVEQGTYAKLRQRIEDRKIARETARQQEKNFLEYRKIMILYEYKPTTKALAKPADDYFPKRKFSFKDMAFGARKSYFLSLRPNSKFANWHGKKKEQEQMEQEKVLNLKTKAKTMMVATAAAQEQKAIEEANAAQKIAAEDAAGMMDDQIRMLDKVSKESISYGTEPPLKGDEVKGTRSMMPMAKGADGRRTFFWISCEGEDEVTDEDCPIDSDKVQEVIDGKLLLKVAEFGRHDFNPYDKLEVLRRLNKLCERETYMMGNTLMSVLRLFDLSKHGDGRKEKDMTEKTMEKTVENEVVAKPRKITWLETIDEYNGQGCIMRMNGRGVPDSELEKKILPLTLHYRE